LKELLIGLIEQYGYAALFGLLALGLAGLPVPDETLMTFVGSLTSFGHMSYVPAVIVAFAGSMTGMLISYFLGKKVGKPFLYRYGKWFYVTPARLEKAEYWFQKYGVWTVSFGYFIPGFRHFTCYLAGITGISFWRYVLFAGSGALVWCMTFITLGYFIGENWEKIMYIAHQYLGVTAIILIGVFIVASYLVYRYSAKKRT
jgi:membrane protein DedA with SNARE-associated domain